MRAPATSLRADAGIVMRTPVLPFETFFAWHAAGDPDAQRRWLLELAARDDVREALVLASPSLGDAIDRWRRDPAHAAHRDVELALARYIARMAGRATPFGLFSGVTPGAIGPVTTLAVGSRTGCRRRTRLDNDYLFALANQLAREPVARERLRFSLNSSLYEVADRLRYAHARVIDQQRSYHLVSVEPTPYLRATLERARPGARRADLAMALVRDVPAVSADEALAFVDELIDAQVLVPALGVAITGGEPIGALIAQLDDAGLAASCELLVDVRAALAALDERVGNAPERYRAIAERLAAGPTKIAPGRLFQVDLVTPGVVAIAPDVVAALARAIEWLRTTTRVGDDATLVEFRRQFRERYEDRAVPLAEVLDEDLGIGYAASHAPAAVGAPLVATLAFPDLPRTERVAWGRREVHLLRRVARLAPGDELVLDEADTRALEVSPAPRGPDALAALIRIAGDPEQVARGDYQLLLEGTAGPSGARLLGRFCAIDPLIEAMVRSHLRAEEALRPDAVFAEIVHLSEARMGNILCRPVLREHEIVYLGISGAPAERQLPLDDLMIAVTDGRIVLTSRRLGREVVPRLSTAHDYRSNGLGIYRFLCAIQNQREDVVIGWTWGPLRSLPRLPRVRLGNVVLARATWSLDEADLAPITRAVRGGDAATIATEIRDLRDRLELPRWIVIAQGDQELPIDLDNAMLAAVFAAELSGSQNASLVELFPAPDALPVRGPEGHHANEIVVTFTRAAPPRRTPAVHRPRIGDARRTFSPASPWLYMKLYAGSATLDRILCAAAPTIRSLVAAGESTHWFFVRYQDPDSHLRLRFAGDPTRLGGTVLPALERALEPFVTSGAIWKIQLDTYERELERYGGEAGIDACERLFWLDSEAVLAIVELLEGDAGAEARWKLAARGCDQLLEALGQDAPARAALFTDARDRLGVELGVRPAFYAQVGERWRRERADLEALLARDPAIDRAHAYAPALAILDERSARLAALRPVLRAVPGFDEIAWSLVHMHANRILHASQRAQELVLYDLLRRWHASQRARAR